jgi:hypothetical protein
MTTLPPPGDPRRSLIRAADETKSLGLCMIGLGALAGTCFMSNLMMLTGAGFGRGGGIYLLSLVISCGAFGVFYVFAARMMRAGRAWAPTAVLAVTGAQTAWVIGFLGWNLWIGRKQVVGGILLPSMLWLAALGVVAYYAILAARAIRTLALDGPPGFEISQSVMPIEPTRITKTPNRDT